VQRHDDLAGADGVRGEHGAVQHQMRPGTHEEGVFARGGFTFGSVDHHYRPPAPGDGAHLASGGEAGSTMSGQAGPLDGVDQHHGAAIPPEAAQEKPPVVVHVLGQGHRPHRIGTAKQKSR